MSSYSLFYLLILALFPHLSNDCLMNFALMGCDGDGGGGSEVLNVFLLLCDALETF